MTIFSFHRYALLLKKHLVEDWRRQLTLAGISAAIIVLAYAFMLMFLSIDVYGTIAAFDSDDVLMPISIFFKVLAFGILAFMVCYQAAHSMPFRATKARQIAYSTLPVTTAERYAVSLTLSTVITVVECIIGFLVADIIIAVTSGHFLIFAPDYLGRFMSSMQDPAYNVLTHPATVLSYILSILTVHSWYTLCATMFRRHPFLVGTLIYMLASQILGMLSIGTLGMFDFFASPDVIQLSFDTIGTWIWASNVISIAIVVIFYILSYIRVKRMQI